MGYAKRNDALGNWNFEEQDIYNGNNIMDNPDVVKVAKEVAKWILRAIELKMENEDILGQNYCYKMGVNISDYADVTVHGERNSRVFIRCGGCQLGEPTEHKLKGLAWAIYQHAMPKVLKKCKHISEYGISVSYNSVFGNASISIELVLE